MNILSYERQTERVLRVGQFLEAQLDSCAFFPFDANEKDLERFSATDLHKDKLLIQRGIILQGTLWLPPVLHKAQSQNRIHRSRDPYMRKSRSNAWCNHLPKISDGEKSIPLVVVDHQIFSPRNHGRNIQLIRWNWISQPLSYIEAEVVCIQDIVEKVQFETPKRPAFKNPISGIIRSIGPLIRKAEGKSHFMMQFHADSEQLLYISCSGLSYERIYPSLHCGAYLSILHFKGIEWVHEYKGYVAILSDTFAESTDVLSIGHSTMNTSTRPRQNISTISAPSPFRKHGSSITPIPKAPPTCLHAPRDNEDLISYRGVLTKYLGFGVFILDEAYTLYTTRMGLQYPALGFRVGCTVLVSNCHVVQREDVIKGLFCCFRTSVEVIQFSAWKEPQVPMMSSIEFLSVINKLEAKKSIWILDHICQCQEALGGLVECGNEKAKVAEAMVFGILDLCLPDLRDADYYLEFTNHQSCSFTKPSTVPLNLVNVDQVLEAIKQVHTRNEPAFIRISCSIFDWMSVYGVGERLTQEGAGHTMHFTSLKSKGQSIRVFINPNGLERGLFVVSNFTIFFESYFDMLGEKKSEFYLRSESAQVKILRRQTQGLVETYKLEDCSSGVEEKAMCGLWDAMEKTFSRDRSIEIVKLRLHNLEEIRCSFQAVIIARSQSISRMILKSGVMGEPVFCFRLRVQDEKYLLTAVIYLTSKTYLLGLTAGSLVIFENLLMKEPKSGILHFENDAKSTTFVIDPGYKEINGETGALPWGIDYLEKICVSELSNSPELVWRFFKIRVRVISFLYLELRNDGASASVIATDGTAECTIYLDGADVWKLIQLNELYPKFGSQSYFASAPRKGILPKNVINILNKARQKRLIFKHIRNYGSMVFQKGQSHSLLQDDPVKQLFWSNIHRLFSPQYNIVVKLHPTKPKQDFPKRILISGGYYDVEVKKKITLKGIHVEPSALHKELRSDLLDLKKKST